jgi:hypothetical protein
MKTLAAAVLALSLGACGGRETTDAPVPAAPERAANVGAAAAPAQAQAFTDEQLGLRPYPGATEMPNSRLRALTVEAESLTVYSTTPDTPVQVAAFYRKELESLGTVEEGISIGDQLQSLSVQRADGSMSGMQARTGGTGPTVISIHRRIPKAKV